MRLIPKDRSAFHNTDIKISMSITMFTYYKKWQRAALTTDGRRIKIVFCESMHEFTWVTDKTVTAQHRNFQLLTQLHHDVRTYRKKICSPSPVKTAITVLCLHPIKIRTDKTVLNKLIFVVFINHVHKHFKIIKYIYFIKLSSKWVKKKRF
jgi:hypothetical protein